MNIAIVKQKLKTSPLTKSMYSKLKRLKNEHQVRMKFKFNGDFIDRSNGSEYLVIVLAGYKNFLHPTIFERIKCATKPDIDVCVISSGMYSSELDELCKTNSWSYLSTKQNNVCLVQNVAIQKHPNAKYIFKLDEDVFIPANYFERMIKAYEHALSEKYRVGVLAPMLTINGFSSPLILEKLEMVNTYVEKFGEFKFETGPDTTYESNPDFAKFMWGDNGLIPSIDVIDAKCSQNKTNEIPCPYRFSIGAILFERSLWEKMGYFTVKKGDTGMGLDEIELDSYCFLNSRPLMVSENIVAGHLSFGKQNAVMKEYYMNNKEKFDIKKA